MIKTDQDTIAAISTPIGEGGISIIRVSGEDALTVVNPLFKGKDLTQVATHTINYGHIINPTDHQVADEVMVSVMLAPKTYTKEDVVEINCHGGLVATNRILQLVLTHGARLAEPGEFTKRAFLNGRLDLSQAEAVMDLIRAKTDKSMDVAMHQLNGDLSNLIRQFRQDILDVLAQVEVNIDYPEYDAVEEMTSQLLREKATDLQQHIQGLLKTARQGKVLRDGLATAIIGRPNVGKSSLLNTLLHEDKAIVTNVAGTTRDVIEEYVNVEGVPLKLIDTAGIRHTDDQVEKIGVERSRQAIKTADLILLLIDQSRPLSAEDRDLIELTKGLARMVILNKTDLPTALDFTELKHLVGDDVIIQTSIANQSGMQELGAAISHRFFNEGIEAHHNDVLITNARHISLLTQAEQALGDVLEGLNDGLPVDLVQIDLTTAWNLLGEITGDSYQDELLDQLFSQFCLGK